MDYQITWAWSWFLIGLFNQRSIICLGQGNTTIFPLIEGESGTTMPETTTILPFCCSDDYSKEFCNSSKNAQLKWDILKFYRIPKINSSMASAVSTVINKNQLECKSHISITVPRWENIHLESSVGTKGYFAAFHSDGYLHFGKYTFAPEDYCVNRFTNNEIVVTACDYSKYCSDSESSVNKIFCISRCCDYGEVWDITGKFKCTHSGTHKWMPQIHFGDPYEDDSYYEVESGGVTISSTAMKKPLLISTHPRDLMKSCKSSATFHSFHPAITMLGQRPEIGRKPFRVLANGTVWMKIRKHEWVQLQPGEYCIDGFQYGKGTFSGNNEESLLFECKAFESIEKLNQNEVQRKLSFGFGLILILCLMFLLVTALVYILLWSKHNIHGWTVFGYILALTFSYLFLGISHFSTASLTRNKKTYGSVEIVTFCGIIGVVSHFTFLSVFSWSSVLNFDLFVTFHNLRPTTEGNSKGRKRFIFYLLFALMVPALIVTIGVILDLQYREDIMSNIVTPEYGKSLCYVEAKYARFYFVILPIAVLLGVNLILFCNTAYSLYQVKKSTQFATSSSTRTQNEAGNQTSRLILKLFMINGTIWVAEIISWYLQRDYYEIGPISYILDILNVLQAVAVFFIFVFKNDILEALKRSYPFLEGPVNFAFRLKRLGRPAQSRGINRGTSTTCSNPRTNETSVRVTKV